MVSHSVACANTYNWSDVYVSTCTRARYRTVTKINPADQNLTICYLNQYTTVKLLKHGYVHKACKKLCGCR